MYGRYTMTKNMPKVRFLFREQGWNLFWNRKHILKFNMIVRLILKASKYKRVSKTEVV